MKIPIPLSIIKFLCLIFLCNTSSVLNAQENSEILERFEDYTEAPRELVYLHLNKSTYIKGEYIGFTAYVLNKTDKTPSLITKNLYVSVEDQNQIIIKQKLLKVENGIASNIFDIDSCFASGHYTIKAYTNWMRNFNEQNHFVESVKIIDTEIEQYIKKASIKNEIDAQFMPEGGHILNGINNTIGVVLKDEKGFGIPNAKGLVFDKNGILISEFQVNHLGIGRFPLLAEFGTNYSIVINYLNKEKRYNLNHNIEPIGITLSILQHRNKAIIALMTNKESLKHLKNKTYQLTIHNGNEIEVVDITFDKETTIIKAFDLTNIPSGINIFTLFNEKNRPVAERLFFNYNGVDIIKSNAISIKKLKDSAVITMTFKEIDVEQLHNLSVSALPKETQSYNSHHNIISYNLLKPYVKGKIENASYYFSEISEEKKLELDNLLITQGWSSYDWNNIKVNTANLPYQFEQGITLKANVNAINKSEESIYIMHSTSAKKPHYFQVSNTEKNHFHIDCLFPNESDHLYLSTFDKKELIVPPKIYFQSEPNSIPKLYSANQFLKPKENYKTTINLYKNKLHTRLYNTQKLDEVVVKVKIDESKLRLEQLQKDARGRIKLIDDKALTKYIFLADFLAMNGYKVNEDALSGTLNVGYFSVFRSPPAIYLNGFIVNDATLLYRYAMDTIDYIELDKSATLGRAFGGNTDGAIRITSYVGSRIEDNRKKKLEYKFPLTFASYKKFYVPQYRYYNDDFYKGYGTIDWKPQLVTDTNGNISMKISKPQVPITLFIEGITNDGAFIFEEKSISLN